MEGGGNGSLDLGWRCARRAVGSNLVEGGGVGHVGGCGSNHQVVAVSVAKVRDGKFGVHEKSWMSVGRSLPENRCLCNQLLFDVSRFDARRT